MEEQPMGERMSCSKCGAPILVRTALKTNGLCMPCKGGYRESIEAGKRYAQERRDALERRERDRTEADLRLWSSLIEQVHYSPAGFDGLSHSQKLYFAVGGLERHVCNGGFHQYFLNDAGSYYAYAEEGLIAIGAFQTLELLREAKEMLFSAGPVPATIDERRRALFPRGEEGDLEIPKWIKSIEARLDDPRLDDLVRRYWVDSEGVGLRMKALARDCGLITNAGGDSGLYSDLYEHVDVIGDISRAIKDAFFPPDTFTGPAASETNYWYSSVLSSLGEAPLWRRSPDAEETWRFTYIGSWGGTRTATLSIHCTGAGSVRYKCLGVDQVLSTQASANQVFSFFDMLRRAEFWDAPTEIRTEGCDGAQWLLEGIKEGRYHLVARWSPGFESQAPQILAFAKACRLLLEYAGEPGE